MKKIIALVLISLLIGGVAFANIGTPAYRITPGIGEIKNNDQGGTQSDPTKTFRMVRYAAKGVATDGNKHPLSADHLAVWDTVSDDGVTVTTSVVSGDTSIAGVVTLLILTPDSGTYGNTAVQDRGRRNWGWIQTYGLCQISVDSVSGIASAGTAFGNSGKEPGEAAGYDTTINATGTKAGCAGFAYDAGAKNANNVEAFVRLN